MKEIRQVDGWISVQDYLNQYNPEDPYKLWKQICTTMPELGKYAEYRYFPHEYKKGRTVPQRAVCLHENALVLLEIGFSKLNQAEVGVSVEKVAVERVLQPEDSKLTSEVEASGVQIPRVFIRERLPKRLTRSGYSYIVAGKGFIDSDSLRTHLKGILNRTSTGSYLKGEDLNFMIDLLEKHKRAKADLMHGLYGILVDQRRGHNYKAFYLDIPNRKQIISIDNYLRPSQRREFEVKLLSPV